MSQTKERPGRVTLGPQPLAARLLARASIAACLTACSLTDLDYLRTTTATSSTGSGGAGGAGGAGTGATGGTGGDCPESPDLTSDPLNCGRCGRDCLGGDCIDAACLPVVVESGYVHPHYLVLDGTHVYFTDESDAPDGGVFRVRKDGTSAQRLATQDAAFGLAVDEEHVYFTQANDPQPLSRVPKDASAGPVELADGSGTEIALDPSEPDSIYFSDFYSAGLRDVFRWNKDQSGAPESVTLAQACESIKFAGPHMFLGGVAVRRVLKADGSVGETLADISSRRIAVDATHVFWVGYTDDRVYAVPQDGSTEPVTLATGPEWVLRGDIAVDDTYVYWVSTQGIGYVLRIKKDGSEPTPTIISSGEGPSSGVAVDDKAVYWTVWETSDGAKDGKIVKRAK